MPSYVFPGYPSFLEDAAKKLGHPESAGPARRIQALTALANLCAQACLAHPAHVAGILAKAAEYRDQLATALGAADLMMADVQAGRKPTPPKVQAGPGPEPEPEPEKQVGPPESRSDRKGPRTSRDSS